MNKFTFKRQATRNGKLFGNVSILENGIKVAAIGRYEVSDPALFLFVGGKAISLATNDIKEAKRAALAKL